MVDAVELITSAYSFMGLITFLVCVFHDDIDVGPSVLLGIFWPVYIIKFIKNYLKEN